MQAIRYGERGKGAKCCFTFREKCARIGTVFGRGRTRMKKRAVYIVLLVIFLAVFLYCGYRLADYLIDSAQQKQKYNALAEIVERARREASTTPPETQGAPDKNSEPVTTEPAERRVPVKDANTGETVYMLAEYAPLYEMNSDMVGWLKIDGTGVNYPVMQTPNWKDYYLYVGFDDKYSTHGSLYAREQCDVNTPSDNVTVYGHKMVDGSMFAELHKYLKQEFWQEHRTFTFDTLFEHRTYEIVSVFRTTATYGQGFAYHEFVDAEDAEEFDNFVATAKSLELYDTGVTAAYGDKLVCLSTCEFTRENGRLVVMAKLISEAE